ncbi:MAG: methylmalonyl Co-A mutase-associated GTPase MeaB [Acidiferrobacterales bacterium]
MKGKRARHIEPRQNAGSLAEVVRSGDRRALARAITLIESTHAEHRAAASILLEQLAPYTGQSIRIGITGVPGVGKSTFIEALGNYVIDDGHRVAVLSIDPSSALSGGSILGDKTRMQELSRRAEAFIRPSPAGETRGGVARHTRETILVCEAAGFNVVIVETVGVGQSETAVADMTDVFILLLLPSGGDELQGMKRGIVELADLVLVNKADGELDAAAQRAAAEYANALRLIHPRSASWTVPVKTCSALTGVGIAEAWATILRYHEALSKSGELATRHGEQARAWMWAETAENLIATLKDDPKVRSRVSKLEAAVTKGRTPPTVAARELLDIFLKQRHKE